MANIPDFDKQIVVLFNPSGVGAIRILVNPADLADYKDSEECVINPDLSNVKGWPMHLWCLLEGRIRPVTFPDGNEEAKLSFADAISKRNDIREDVNEILTVAFEKRINGLSEDIERAKALSALASQNIYEELKSEIKICMIVNASLVVAIVGLIVKILVIK